VNFERNLGFLLGDVARLTRTAFDRRVALLGLTRYVFRNHGLTQSELVDHLEIGKVALGNLIDWLQAKGWVDRRPDPNDRRINWVHLTDKAAPIMDDMRAPA